MFNIRFYVCRTGTMKRFFTFQRPPPGYMFKRPVVPSDLEPRDSLNVFDCENEKWCDDKYISKKDFENPGNKKGSVLYYPKYGSSIYDDNIKNEIFSRYNSRED